MKEIDILGKKFMEGLQSEYHVEPYRHITGRGLVSMKQFCLRATSWRDSDGDYHHSWMDGRHDPSRFIPMYKRIAAILMGDRKSVV